MGGGKACSGTHEGLGRAGQQGGQAGKVGSEQMRRGFVGHSVESKLYLV